MAEEKRGRKRERGGEGREREEGEGTIFLPASASLPLSSPLHPPLSFYSPSGKIVPQPRRNYTYSYRAAACYVIYI